MDEANVNSKNTPLSLLMQGHLFILPKLHVLNFKCHRSNISHPRVWVQTKGFLPLKTQGSLEPKPRGLELELHKPGAADSTDAAWPPSVTVGFPSRAPLAGFFLHVAFPIRAKSTTNRAGVEPKDRAAVLYQKRQTAAKHAMIFSLTGPYTKVPFSSRPAQMQFSTGKRTGVWDTHISGVVQSIEQSAWLLMIFWPKNSTSCNISYGCSLTRGLRVVFLTLRQYRHVGSG